jgi:hypothetical protein
MYFQIKEVVLWPKKSGLGPRRVQFELGKANVITGESRTGKSAIIPIIDYCLGADKCTIPVKTIRDACAWFGVVVQTNQGQKLLARREPGNRASTSEMFVLEDQTVQIPDKIMERNATSEIVRGMLDELAGLTSLDFDPDVLSGFRGRPSFRDLAAFTFQPQNVVANPNVLFFKADSYEHREKLRTIFPFVLGVVTAEVLAKQHELAELRRDLKRREQELQDIMEVSERWVTQLQTNVSRAVEFGLLESFDFANFDRDRAIGSLRQVAGRRASVPHIKTSNLDDTSSRLRELRESEAQQSLVLSELRQRLVEMDNLRDASTAYRRSIQVQQNRLEVSRFVAAVAAGNQPCPVCGSETGHQHDRLKDLTDALTKYEATAAKFQILPQTFDREYERVRSEIGRSTEKLEGLQQQMRSLQEISESERARRYTELNIARFVGRLEADLEIYDRVRTTGELRDAISDLRERIGQLMRDVAEAALKDKLNRALETVATLAGRFISVLDVERPDDRISLAVNDLTVRVKGSERDDYLWEIGSGSNWLSYHIAVSLALQMFFLQRIDESPVPSFLVYDQPSQVYFPKRLADVETADTELDPELRDADVEALRKAFRAFGTAVSTSENQLQVIVLDHAAENVWSGIAGVHEVEDWREGRKLVPAEWLSS